MYLVSACVLGALISPPPLHHSRPACSIACRGSTPRLALQDATIFDSPLPAELEDDAAALLEEAEGDVEKAQQNYIGYTLAYLEEAMPEHVHY